MYDIAEQVLAWQQNGRSVRLVRVIESRGFSSRQRARVAALTPGLPPVGTLLTNGSADHSLWSALVPDPRDRQDAREVVELVVDEAQAAEAHLSCGGTARLLVQPSSDVPAEVWAKVLDREAVCLVTVLSGDTVGGTVAFDSASDVPADAAYRPDVERMLSRGLSETVLLAELESPVVVTALSPVPAVLVVGEGSIADALVSQARLLGWSAETTNDADSAVEAAGRLASGDAVLVLSHDRDVDVPALTAGLAGRAHYVGALGSRHTQTARVAWLTERGVSSNDLSRIHGPAGLDLGAYTHRRSRCRSLPRSSPAGSAPAGSRFAPGTGRCTPDRPIHRPPPDAHTRVNGPRLSGPRGEGDGRDRGAGTERTTRP